jgi:hypothetical protein
LSAAFEKGKQFESRRAALARDTLRLEVCYPLNGSDFSPERNPMEAGLGFFVDLTKPKFVGREALLKTKEDGSAEKLASFRMEGKGPPPRPHYSIFRNGGRIGEVTSGTLSPSITALAWHTCPRSTRRSEPGSTSRFAGKNFRPSSKRNLFTKNHERPRGIALHRKPRMDSP